MANVLVRLSSNFTPDSKFYNCSKTKAPSQFLFELLAATITVQMFGIKQTLFYATECIHEPFQHLPIDEYFKICSRLFQGVTEMTEWSLK